MEMAAILGLILQPCLWGHLQVVGVALASSLHSPVGSSLPFSLLFLVRHSRGSQHIPDWLHDFRQVELPCEPPFPRV